jgi:hypothetical protein
LKAIFVLNLYHWLCLCAKGTWEFKSWGKDWNWNQSHLCDISTPHLHIFIKIHLAIFTIDS